MRSVWLAVALIIIGSIAPVRAQTTTPSPNFDKVEDISILRLLYPRQAFIAKNEETTSPKKYQIGEIENHKVAILAKITGKFSQQTTPEMLAIIGVDTGNEKIASIPSGFQAILFHLDREGVPELVAYAKNVSRETLPFGSRVWQPALTTDLDLDKQDDLVMQEKDSNSESYSLYHWDGKDFIAVTDHPATALLGFYANLDIALRQGLEGDNPPGSNALVAAFDKLSGKLQGLQSVDTLKRRMQNTKSLELTNLKLLIKSATSALMRLQYKQTMADGITKEFEADYQIKKFDNQWLIDSERLKTLVNNK